MTNGKLHATCFFHSTEHAALYTLSLHDALPISRHSGNNFSAGERDRHFSHYALLLTPVPCSRPLRVTAPRLLQPGPYSRSEEHTSELQSLVHLVCRLLLEKTKALYGVAVGTLPG